MFSLCLASSETCSPMDQSDDDMKIQVVDLRVRHVEKSVVDSLTHYRRSHRLTVRSTSSTTQSKSMSNYYASSTSCRTYHSVEMIIIRSSSTTRYWRRQWRNSISYSICVVTTIEAPMYTEIKSRRRWSADVSLTSYECLGLLSDGLNYFNLNTAKFKSSSFESWTKSFTASVTGFILDIDVIADCAVGRSVIRELSVRICTSRHDEGFESDVSYLVSRLITENADIVVLYLGIILMELSFRQLRCLVISDDQW